MSKILFKLFALIFIFVIIYSFISLFIPGYNNASSQDLNAEYQYDPGAIKRNCGTMELLDKIYKEEPSYKDVLSGINEYIKDYSQKHPVTDNVVVTIPTVVHVIYYTAQQNISFEQVLTQINVLNKDFRRRNSDTTNTPVPFKPVAGDPQVEFCLAKRDPSGNPTLGVTRTQTTVAQFGLGSEMKFTSLGGHDVWDRDKYLNLWVCNLGSGLLGFATFPGGNPATDGVVIGYNYFGTIGTASSPFHLGRTATHEVGHWLSLYHIWGDDNGACFGSDQVEDTPNQGPENYGCPGYPHITCENGPSGDMFMNYMDYTDDGCMNIYTQGQIVRMTAAINGPRSPLLTSNGCTPVSGVPICYFSADSLVINLGGTVHFTDQSAGIPTSWNWTFTGGTPSSSTQQNPSVVYNTPGYYTVKLRVSNIHGSDSVTRVNQIRVLGPAMNTFNIVSPPMLATITTSPSNTTTENFIWTKTSNSPLVTYKFKIRKAGSQVDMLFASNNSGADTVFGIRNNLLDSLAQVFGITGDSVRCVWKATAYNGIDSLTSNSFILTLKRSVIGVKKISSSVPEKFALYNNYPNPFNPVTKIKFAIPLVDERHAFHLQLKIYDILGKEVASLLPPHWGGQEGLTPGIYEVDWNASGLSSGIYFYRLESSDFVDTKKMILIK